MESDSLKDFLRGIVQEKAGLALDDDIMNQLVSDLYERLENQIYRSLVNELNDEQLNELESKDRTPEDIMLFIENSGVVVKDVITKVLIQFRASYLGA